MKKIFVTRKLLKENEDKLSELFKVKLNLDDKIYSAQDIIDGLEYDFEAVEKVNFSTTENIGTRISANP